MGGKIEFSSSVNQVNFPGDTDSSVDDDDGIESNTHNNQLPSDDELDSPQSVSSGLPLPVSDNIRYMNEYETINAYLTRGRFTEALSYYENVPGMPQYLLRELRQFLDVLESQGVDVSGYRDLRRYLQHQ